MRQFSINTYLILLMVVLCCCEIISGSILLFHYRANTDEAFSSLQIILQSDNLAWLWYDLHKIGANLLIACCYIYLFTTLWRQQYKYWFIKTSLMTLMLLSAYSGTILPWSQLSVWLLQAVPHLTLSKTFLAHVIFLPVLLLVIAIFAYTKIKLFASPVKTNPTFFSSRLFSIIIFIFICFFFALLFPDVFSLRLENFSAHNNLPVLYYYPPWYVAAWFAIYKSFGYAALCIAILLWFSVPVLLKRVAVSWQQQFHPIIASLLFLSLLGLTVFGMYLYDARNLFLAQCLTVFYFLLWLGLIIYSWWKRHEEK